MSVKEIAMKKRVLYRIIFETTLTKLGKPPEHARLILKTKLHYGYLPKEDTEEYYTTSFKEAHDPANTRYGVRIDPLKGNIPHLNLVNDFRMVTEETFSSLRYVCVPVEVAEDSVTLEELIKELSKEEFFQYLKDRVR